MRCRPSRQTCRRVNAERKAVMDLMELQKEQPPQAWGCEIYEAVLKAQEELEPERRINQLRERCELYSSRPSPVSPEAKRILISGCPIGGVYSKVIRAVEENGGVITAFENCEMIDSNQRIADADSEDMISALADCYQNTPCAIMSPNSLRFMLVSELAREYKADGILDIALTTCHAYTVERDRMRRCCRELGLPYLAIDTDSSNADYGQITTRVAAFMEML
ncbi:MAG: 2-hydroxyacyl-CoA dehydratase [Oscillospiraceae bacterium]|nr:2-hydroxyacyl-CoA dehydratase [Oscillospiraceae bacterium]